MILVGLILLSGCFRKDKKETIQDITQDSISVQKEPVNIDTVPTLDTLNNISKTTEEIKETPSKEVNIKTESVVVKTTTPEKKVSQQESSTKSSTPVKETTSIKTEPVTDEEPKEIIPVETEPVTLEKPMETVPETREEPQVVKPVVMTKNYSLTSGTVTIRGTSSLHDWEEKATGLTCNVTASYDNENIKFESLVFNVKAKSLKSGKDLMDKKTYEALKADKYSDITFKMTSPSSFKLDGDAFNGTVTGTLNMAGQTKTITVYIKGMKKTDNALQISTSKKLKMTDYNMKPPTALMGSIKTGDEVTVIVNLNL